MLSASRTGLCWKGPVTSDSSLTSINVHFAMSVSFCREGSSAGGSEAQAGLTAEGSIKAGSWETQVLASSLLRRIVWSWASGLPSMDFVLPAFQRMRWPLSFCWEELRKKLLGTGRTRRLVRPTLGVSARSSLPQTPFLPCWLPGTCNLPGLSKANRR